MSYFGAGGYWRPRNAPTPAPGGAAPAIAARCARLTPTRDPVRPKMTVVRPPGGSSFRHRRRSGRESWHCRCCGRRPNRHSCRGHRGTLARRRRAGTDKAASTRGTGQQARHRVPSVFDSRAMCAVGLDDERPAARAGSMRAQIFAVGRAQSCKPPSIPAGRVDECRVRSCCRPSLPIWCRHCRVQAPCPVVGLFCRRWRCPALAMAVAGWGVALETGRGASAGARSAPGLRAGAPARSSVLAVRSAVRRTRRVASVFARPRGQ